MRPRAVGCFVVLALSVVTLAGPARAVERLPAGWEVMAGDAVAGLYTYATVPVPAAVPTAAPR